jgi:Tfp pilus assembly protein FimT
MLRRGHSLPELLVVIALTALATALGVPAITHAMDRRLVEAAARQIIDAHREARMIAVASQRTALLRLAADTIELHTTDRGDTTFVWRRPGPRSFGVEVVGNPRLIRFIPYGYSIGGSNTSYEIRKGAAHRKVVIARLGRVRVE